MIISVCLVYNDLLPCPVIINAADLKSNALRLMVISKAVSTNKSMVLSFDEMENEIKRAEVHLPVMVQAELMVFEA